MKEEVQRELFIVKHNGTHIVVECPDAATARKLLSMDACELDGDTLQIQKAEYSMQGDDIYDFVDRLLNEENELRGLQQTCGSGVRQGRRNDSPAVQFHSVPTPP